MNNMLLRSVSGAVFIILVLGSVLLHPVAMIFCLGLFSALALIEFYNFFKNSEQVSVSKGSGLFVGLSIYAAVLVFLSKLQFESLILAFIFLLIFSLFLSEIWKKKENPLLNIGVYASSFMYAVLPFLIMVLIALQYSNVFLATMFILIWTNDTFAYLSGRFFGKNKLFPRISPNKTWEGTIGGSLLTMLMAVGITYYSDQNYLLWIVAALIISVTSNLGDLLESLFKRTVDVKDSGNIMPGHGGILDRFDAALITAPFFYCWLVIYNYF
ncbi:MAG: phosphatidate cytidylyltransferase [Crocinitomicaceae bacterium]|nr:phosphatidate cytidylyltransferase [Crocinitomicaceae bacterium]